MKETKDKIVYIYIDRREGESFSAEGKHSRIAMEEIEKKGVCYGKDWVAFGCY